MTGLRESGFELPEVNQIEVRFQDVFEDMDLYCIMKHRYMVFIYYLFVCTYMYMMYNMIYMYIKCVCKLCCFGKRLRLYGKNYWEPFSPLRYTAGDNCQKWRPTMRSMATWRRQKPEFGASWTLFFINKSSLFNVNLQTFLMFNIFNQKRRKKTWFVSLWLFLFGFPPSFSFLV